MHYIKSLMIGGSIIFSVHYFVYEYYNLISVLSGACVPHKECQ